MSISTNFKICVKLSSKIYNLGMLFSKDTPCLNNTLNENLKINEFYNGYYIPLEKVSTNLSAKFVWNCTINIPVGSIGDLKYKYMIVDDSRKESDNITSVINLIESDWRIINIDCRNTCKKIVIDDGVFHDPNVNRTKKPDGFVIFDPPLGPWEPRSVLDSDYQVRIFLAAITHDNSEPIIFPKDHNEFSNGFLSIQLNESLSSMDYFIRFSPFDFENNHPQAFLEIKKENIENSMITYHCSDIKKGGIYVDIIQSDTRKILCRAFCDIRAMMNQGTAENFRSVFFDEKLDICGYFNFYYIIIFPWKLNIARKNSYSIYFPTRTREKQHRIYESRAEIVSIGHRGSGANRSSRITIKSRNSNNNNNENRENFSNESQESLKYVIQNPNNPALDDVLLLPILNSGSSNVIRENSILALTTGSKNADFVEFDVQLTADHIPVIYHDLFVKNNGISIPIQTINYQNFVNYNSIVNNSHTLESKGSKNQIRGGMNLRKNSTESYDFDYSNEKISPPRSRKMKRTTSDSSISSVSETDRRRISISHGNHLDTPNNNNNNNNIGYSDKEGFFINQHEVTTSLEHALEGIDFKTGFNIEVKYPTDDWLKTNNVKFIERNVWVDKILDTVFEVGTKYSFNRDIIFSSFDTTICTMLSLKQDRYPVFMLTEGGSKKAMEIAIDIAANTPLLGIVCDSLPLIKTPKYIQTILDSGLFLFTYGGANNHPENIRFLVSQGVDGIISDDLSTLKRTLESMKV